MAWNQPYFWPSYEPQFRPQMLNRMPMHRGTSQHPYGSGYQQRSLNPLASVEQQLTRRSLLAAPLPEQQRLYMDFAGPVKLELQYKVNSVAAEVTWNSPGLSHSTKYQYQVQIFGCSSCALEVPNWRKNVRIQVVSGQWYDVSVKAVTQGKVTLAEGKVKFKAILSQSEIFSLSKKAEEYVGAAMHRFEFFYRNKPKRYWDEIRYRDGIMRPYLKDNNGNPGNPINGEINGLFFSSNLANGEFPKCSPFGDVRLYVPAPHLLNPDCNMYFSDFYCIYAIHYVTVVVTRPGSLADQFCAKQLVRLSPRDNVFICVRPSIYDGRLEYWVNGNVWVEMLVTEDVDIRVGRFSLVRSTGESTPGGLKNNRFCQICNLYPKEPKTMEEIAIAQGQKAISDASRPNKLPLNTNSDSAKRVKANEYGNKTSTSALIASLLVNLEAEKNFPVDDEDKLSLSNVTMEAVLDAIGEFQSVPDRSVAICDVATVLCSIVDRVVVESDFKTEIASILEELVNRAVKICEQVENPLTLKRKRKSTEIEEDYDYSDSEVPSTSGNSTGTQLESFFEGNDLSEIPDYEAKFQEWIQSVNTSTSTMQSSESNTTSAPLENEVGAEEIKMTPVKNVYPWTNELYQPPEPSKPPEISPPKSVTKGFLSPPTQISDASKAVKQRANVVETHKQVDVNMNQSHKTTLRSKIQNEAVPQQRIQDTSRSRYASLPNRPNLILITSQADPNAQATDRSKEVAQIYQRFKGLKEQKHK